MERRPRDTSARIFACGVLSLALSACSLISLKTPERPLSPRDLNARILTRELSAQFVASVNRCADDITAGTLGVNVTAPRTTSFTTDATSGAGGASNVGVAEKGTTSKPDKPAPGGPCGPVAPCGPVGPCIP